MIAGSLNTLSDILIKSRAVLPIDFEAEPIDVEFFFGNVENAKDWDGLITEHFLNSQKEVRSSPNMILSSFILS